MGGAPAVFVLGGSMAATLLLGLAIWLVALRRRHTKQSQFLYSVQVSCMCDFGGMCGV